MKHRSILILALIVMMVALAACGGGNSSKSIWPDVPIPPDAKGSDMRLPLPMRLLIQAAVRASGKENDVDVNKFDFVGYTTTQTPQQVAEFYSEERMSAAGWSAAEGLGCTAAMGDGGGGGGFCMFTKQGDSQQSVLFIALASDDSSKNTNIYFIRFDGQFSGQ
jgi:hypothetical protein